MFTVIINLFTLVKYFAIIVLTGSNFIFRKIPVIGFIFWPLEIFSLIHINKTKGVRLRNTLVALGPTFIKLGQVLSTRPDVIGEKLAQDFAELQDRLPAFSDYKVQQILKRELNKEFKSFSKQPIAAASIAQVHQAELPDGSKVAVKILRPKINKIFKRDLALLHALAQIIDYNQNLKRLRLPEVISYFKTVTDRELDLRFEAAAANKFQENLKSDPNIIIPQIYWEYTSEKILTSSWIDGIKISKIDELKAKKHNLAKIAENLIICYFNQAYRDGYFHADMHPGNILITKDSKIALIDFGIMGNLSEKDRIYVTRIIDGFVRRDYDQIAKMHYDAGYVPAETNLIDFSLACRSIGEPIFGLAVSQLSLAKMLAQLFQITEKFGMKTQPQLLLLQKTLLIIEGVGAKLDPKLNIWQLGEPWLRNWAEKNLGLKASLNRSKEEIITTISTLPEMLLKLNKLLEIQSRPRTETNKNFIFKLTIITLLTLITIRLF